MSKLAIASVRVVYNLTVCATAFAAELKKPRSLMCFDHHACCVPGIHVRLKKRLCKSASITNSSHDPRLRAKNTVPNPPMPDNSYVRHLRDALHNQLVENSMGREFIPENEFNSLISRTTVCQVFEEIVLSNIAGGAFHPVDFRKWELVFEEYRKVLAVLVFIGHERLIMSFLNHGRGDKKLPFYKEELDIIDGELSHTHFLKKQYCFIAVQFKMGDERNIPEEWILPFIRDTPIRKGEGGFGKIYEVEIHKSYCDPKMRVFSEGEKDKHVFARKELMPADYNDKNFAIENNALKILQAKCQHPNIVPLLASYRYGTQYSFLFPRAECDLYMYFEQTKPPQTDQETLYLFERISKLASALNEIHNCEIVLEVDGRRIDFSQIGYHRDLKPKNILKMGEVFMISDFGLARFKDNKSDSATEWWWGFSTYSAPECKRGASVNRLADVWSLGCIFSEVVTFAVLGMQGIEEYSKIRTQTLSSHVTVDLFYQHETDNVLGEVLKWFDRLRNTSGRSQLILDVLELVEEMLAPVSIRPRAVAVMSKFSEILGRERRRSNITEDTPLGSAGSCSVVKSPDLIADDPSSPSTPPSPALDLDLAIAPGDSSIVAPKRSEVARWRGDTYTLPAFSKITTITENLPMNPQQSATKNRRNTLAGMANPYSRRESLQDTNNTSSKPTGGSPTDRPTSEQQRPQTSYGLAINMGRCGSNNPKLLKPEPLLYKVPGFLAKSQKGKSPFGYLKEFDTVFLIDDSESMIEHWDSVALALCRFLELATIYDSDGVDLHFMGSSEHVNNARTVKAVFSIFRRVRAGGSTSISLSLDNLLSDYVSRFKSDRGTKRLNLIVITDGDITPFESPSDVIVSCAKALDSIMAPKCQVGVQFALIGSSTKAQWIFKDMDDSLWKRNNMRDIVDTTPYDPDMDGRDDETLLKIMCGAVNRLLDNKSAPMSS